MKKVKLPKADANPTKYTPNILVPKDLKANDLPKIDLKVPDPSILVGKPNPKRKKK